MKPDKLSQPPCQSLRILAVLLAGTLSQIINGVRLLRELPQEKLPLLFERFTRHGRIPQKFTHDVFIQFMKRA
jgi:hypothetical protein